MRELQALAPKHFAEAAGDKEIALDPHYIGYLDFEWRKLLHCVTLRAGRLLVGYWIGTVKPHPHHKQSLTAWTDIDFIEAGYRGHARKLYGAVHRHLRSLGVERVYQSAKLVNAKGAFLEAIGYEHVENGYSMILRAAPAETSDRTALPLEAPPP